MTIDEELPPAPARYLWAGDLKSGSRLRPALSDEQLNEGARRMRAEHLELLRRIEELPPGCMKHARAVAIGARRRTP